MNDLVLVGATALGGLATVGLIGLALRKRDRAPREEVVPLEVIEEETVVPLRRDEPAPAFDETPFSVAAPRDPPRPLVALAPAPARAPPVATHPARRPAIILNRGIGPTYDADDPPELPDSSIPTEWARRLVGPPEPGRMKGVCSGCGTHLSISEQRPVRIACPVCGRTRLLSP